MKSINISTQLFCTNLLIGGISLVLVFGTGCSKFVEVEPPKSQLLGEQVFTDPGTASAAMAAVYAQLRNAPTSILSGGANGMTVFLAQYSDEMVNYNLSSQTYGPNFYKNILFPDSEDLYSLWNTSYNQIYNVNAILDGLANAPLLDTTVKKGLTGEALFVRGLLHFYLTNIYGAIPYAKTSDYRVNQSLARMPVKQIYQQVLIDLLMAMDRLPENYPSAGRVRLNKLAAKALMARVLLYSEEWEKAGLMAKEVIEQGMYTPVKDLSKLFLKESTSTIWALQPNTAGANAEEGFTHIIRSANPIRSLSPSQLGAFETGDIRAREWIGSFTKAPDTWYFPYKYKIVNLGQTVDYEYPVVLRIEEQYLIRAEARMHLNKFDEARQDINILRSRAGVGNCTAATRDELVTAILHERQVELFVEYGHRFFDLKRMGKLDEILKAVKPNWDIHHAVFPIPAKELLVNQNLLPQNAGYN